MAAKKRSIRIKSRRKPTDIGKFVIAVARLAEHQAAIERARQSDGDSPNPGDEREAA